MFPVIHEPRGEARKTTSSELMRLAHAANWNHFLDPLSPRFFSWPALIELFAAKFSDSGASMELEPIDEFWRTFHIDKKSDSNLISREFTGQQVIVRTR